ncbi:c-type cytochrome [Mycoplana rhizolycopersici]|jgi:cytochrome c553|uniref:C-type cytochrome n=1 Tax=Mycoplana rhizolycopersici TaxID=2746702 RepID=A0ABX2QKN8_9HYPH|nr:c-type cytochrome [Rhizobium rhizolycopersici]NVP58330.1 c-type cytochrome [Rhizobium rhizolycopersici]
MVIGRKHLAALVLGAALVGWVIPWSGVIGISASTGHWKLTDWFLHWAMRSSVRTSAIGIEVPPLEEGMLPMAAGHFEGGCALCHGSPAMPPPASVRGMLPVPPDLKEVIPTWTDAELFQIVQHGVRFTGMPSWPVAEREDEVWAMVAFLRRYPDLDGASYRRLAGHAAHQSRDQGRVLETCNGCHAPDRLDRDSLVPRLDGQSQTYLRDSLAAYAEGMRPSGIMAVAIQSLTEQERAALAVHFSERTVRGVNAVALSNQTGRGEHIARFGDLDRRIPACMSCHDRTNGNPAYPRLAGQPAAYLAAQLRLFVDEKRGGGPHRALMAKVAANLDDSDIKAVAEYFSARDPSADAGPDHIVPASVGFSSRGR